MISLIKSTLNTVSRRVERAPSPILRLLFDEFAYKTVHWSQLTFIIDAYEGERRPGDEIIIRGIGPERGKVRPVEMRARVVHFDDQKWQLEAVIVELDNADRETLHSLDAANEPDVIAIRDRAQAG